MMAPTFDLEQNLIKQGCHCVAGIDEAGRGPLAGPVVTAAVILDPNALPAGLNDSKKLTQAQRDTAFAAIMETSIVGIATASALRIDAINIRAATLIAMTEAVEALCKRPDHVLIDGRDIPEMLSVPTTAVVKGDSQSLSIAAASIVAKVVRDNIMIHADTHYPGYGLAKHKGYGSAQHKTQITTLGPSKLHRSSFAPMKNM